MRRALSACAGLLGFQCLRAASAEGKRVDQRAVISSITLSPARRKRVAAYPLDMCAVPRRSARDRSAIELGGRERADNDVVRPGQCPHARTDVQGYPALADSAVEPAHLAGVPAAAVGLQRFVPCGAEYRIEFGGKGIRP
jgi:hypothetical protein